MNESKKYNILQQKALPFYSTLDIIDLENPLFMDQCVARS